MIENHIEVNSMSKLRVSNMTYAVAKALAIESIRQFNSDSKNVGIDTTDSHLAEIDMSVSTILTDTIANFYS